MKTLPSNKKIIDYDFHGIVGLRLIGATHEDAKVVKKQIGPPSGHLDREPDIIIRFTEKLPTPKLKYLGLNAGFTGEGFYILGSGRAKLKVKIPFDKIGHDRCEIQCESGLAFIPMLFDIINFTFLKKNYVPLHASAFSYKGTGVLVTGWAKGGKTEALLAFANHGAHYLGDEWVILSSDGKEMFGIPVPICLWDWQLKNIPNLLPEIGTQDKILFNSIKLLDRLHKSFAKGRLKQTFPIKTLEAVLPAFKRQLKIKVQPDTIFNDRCKRMRASLDRVIFIMSHSRPEISVEPIDSLEIVQRMTHSNDFEQSYFFENYKAFKFAFPEKRNDLLDRADKLQTSLLYQALENKEAFQVLHPYPVSFEALFEKLQPICTATPQTPVVATAF